MISLRWTKPGDGVALRKLASSFAEEAGGALGISQQQLVEQYCAPESGFHPTLLAVDTGKPVAFLAGGRKVDGRLREVKGLYVEPPYRRRGLGRRLVLASGTDHAFSAAGSTGFYEALGWCLKSTALGLIQQRPGCSAGQLPFIYAQSVELEDGAHTVELIAISEKITDLDKRVAALWDALNPDYVTLCPGLVTGQRAEQRWRELNAVEVPITLCVRPSRGRVGRALRRVRQAAHFHLG